MTQEKSTSRESRLTKQDYLRVGFRLLAEGGIGAVTIANVCALLGVTKGSFYHHFRSAPAFHGALLDWYEEEYAHRRIAELDAIAGPEDRLAGLVRRGVERDHEAESALRAWARTDPATADVMQRVDATRARYLSTFFVAVGLSPQQAKVNADIALAVLAGAQAMSRTTDRRKVRAMLEEHRRWLVTLIDEARGEQRPPRSNLSV